VQAGIPRSYTDNGDGTITDNVTGLMWEKLSDDASVHDQPGTRTGGCRTSSSCRAPGGDHFVRAVRGGRCIGFEGAVRQEGAQAEVLRLQACGLCL
jgi:hypothetical protein